MEKSTLLLLILLLGIAMHVWSSVTAKSVAAAAGKKLHSLPSFYGYYTSLWCVLPSVFVVVFWSSLEGSVITSTVLHSLPPEMTATSPEQVSLIINDIKNVVAGSRSSDVSPEIAKAAAQFSTLGQRSNLLLTLLCLSLSVIGGLFARSRIAPDFQARNKVERVLTLALIGCALVAILTTVGIVLSVLLESIRFFQMIPITDFLFGLKWSPQIAMRADQAGSSGAFGAIPLITGTMLISVVAMVVAVPIGLLSAIYLSEYATLQFRSITKPLIEILAGIPTVVYGFFAALVVAPFIRDVGARIGLDVSSESALAAGLVMGIMIIPFVSSLSDDFINAVPQSLRDGAYALGATQSETIRQVIIPAALPVLLAEFCWRFREPLAKP